MSRPETEDAAVPDTGLFTTDHRVLGRRFIWAGLWFLLLGGLLAMAIRWQWAWPGRPLPLGRLFLPGSDGAITPAAYTGLFTMHGLVMIFFAITPILIQGLGTALIPLQLGARTLAFPRMSAIAFWLLLLSQALVLVSFALPLGTAETGWTLYPPLATKVGTPGDGQTLVVIAILVTSISSVLTAGNFVTTVIRCRAPGLHFFRLPLSVWGQWLTAILNVLFVPVLAVGAALLLCDRLFGTEFFLAGAQARRGGGDPVLFQHLFWLFGHPEVYILILPAWGIVSDVLAFFARKPAFFYRGSVLAMIAVAALSGLVYAHHMYLAGLAPLLGKGFMVLTLLISFPAEVLVLNWLLTLWRGSIRLTSPMLYALGTVFVFGAGGLTGLYLGAVGTDLYLHDTLWVVGHFHLTMAAATFLASFAGITLWFPKLFGRQLDERLAKAHAVLSTALLTLVFTGQLLAGYAGQSRRLFDPYQYTFLQHLLPLNRWTTYFAFALAAAQLLFVYNFARTLLRDARASANPWELPTLEWTATAPAEVFRGPHELSTPEALARGRDFLGQAEPLLPEGAA